MAELDGGWTSETLLVQMDGTKSVVRAPTLLGAVLLKARALRAVGRGQDRDDLVTLLACVDDPIALRGELKQTERRWLRAVADALTVEGDEVGSRFGGDRVERARAAFRILRQ